MKFLIAGAGAIGAYIGARMAQAGFDVTLFARGPHLRAMQEHGVQVKTAEGDFVARPVIAGSVEEVGPVDVVFLGVKAHGLPQLAPHLKPVLGPDTTVVSTQNGIPWWYFQGFAGEWDGLRLERVDPGGVISSAIEARRVVGSIVYFSTEITAPGVVQHIEGNRISLGEPDGSRSERCRANRRGAHCLRLARADLRSTAARDLGQGHGECFLQSRQRTHPRNAGADGPRS